MKATYKQLREATPLLPYTKWTLVDYVCYLLSPLCSIPFIKHQVKPNTITIFMIFSGLVGGVLFALPFITSKILAIVFYWLWYIFDCSDGEVARYTKTFSKYGAQLDWMAHLVCHPLLLLGVWQSFRQEESPYFDYITVCTILFVACELIRRNLTALDSLLSLSSDMGIKPTASTIPLHRWLLAQIMYFPNFVLFYPILHIVCLQFNWDGIIYVYLTWAGLNILYVIRDMIRHTIFIAKQ